MSDTFIEQIIKKKPTPQDILIKVLILFVGVIVALIMAFIAFNSSLLGPFAALFAVGAIYFTWRLITSLDLEYEYIYTNGEIDVDCIKAKRKRKRITTVKISAFEVFEEYDHMKYKDNKYDVRILACTSIADENTYCATYRGKEGKSCLLVFSPNEKLLNAMGSATRRKKVKA